MRQVPDLSTAILGLGESAAEWLGPVSRERTRVTGRAGSHEANTLLFTEHQVIGFDVGLADLAGDARHPLLGAASRAAVAESSRPIVRARNLGRETEIPFEALNATRWGAIVAPLLGQPLDAVLAGRENFGLPYGQIQEVVVSDRIVNPGIAFELADGTTLRYRAIGRQRLSEVAQFLQPFVTVR